MATRVGRPTTMLVTLSLFLAACARSENTQPTVTTALGAPGQELSLTGTVVKNNLHCFTDGPCWIRLRAGPHELDVFYNYGEAECPNHRAGDVGIALTPGDEVEVFGMLISPDEISTCESEAYYIRKAP